MADDDEATDDSLDKKKFHPSLWHYKLPIQASAVDHVDENAGPMICKRMNEMRYNRQYIDAYIIAGEDEIRIPIHKSVVSSLGSFFEGIVPPALAYGIEQKVLIRDFDYDILKIFVDYAYTGIIAMTNKNVQDLIESSHFMRIKSVEDASSKFLLSQMNASNAMGILSAADEQKCKEVRGKALSYILQNFADVRLSEEFPNASLDLLKEIIGDEKLMVVIDNMIPDLGSQELVILGTVLNFIVNYNPKEEKKKLLNDFMPLVRYWYIDLEALDAIMREFNCYNECNLILVDLENKPKLPRKPAEILKLTNGPFAKGQQAGVGMPFDDSTVDMASPHHVTGIAVWFRAWGETMALGGIKVTYDNGKSYMHGEEVGSCVSEFSLVKNERICSVTLNHGWIVDSLTFETTAGHIHGPFGADTGQTVVNKPPEGSYGYLAHLAGSLTYSRGALAVVDFELIWDFYDLPPVKEAREKAKKEKEESEKGDKGQHKKHDSKKYRI